MPAEIPDRYEVLEVVSDTASERVVHARDRRLERDVLIKAHAPGLLGERALREARALARIDRPDVARMIDVLDVDDGVLLVLEPCRGETLAERLAREGRLSADETACLGVAVGEALGAVHRAGLVHRDVGPDTIVLRPRRGPCLVGFTFVKTTPGVGDTSLAFDTAASAESAPRPRHPAPEQLRGRAADARADVYALGCTLYTCLVGEAPTPDARGALPPLSIVAPHVPAPLRGVVERCVAPSPLERPDDGAVVAAELRAALAAAPDDVGAPADPPGGTARRVGVATLAAAALVVLAFALTHLSGAPREPDDEAARGRPLRAPLDTAALSPDYARSRALVVAIGETYADAGFPTLANAERDGRAVADRLTAMSWEGWDVRALIGADATRVAILRELDALERAAGPDDRVFVFYAGHGEAHERSDYGGHLIPADARPLDDDPGRSSWISFGRLQDVFDQCSAKHILLCVDSCYGGRVTAARSSGGSSRAARYVSRPAHLVLTSGRPFEQVSDGLPGGHSPFTRALLECLTRTDEAFVTTADLLVHMQDVFDADDVPHNPSLGHPSGTIGGHVVFFPTPP